MLIALTGLKRSGKDTVANYLIKNYNFKKFAFSEPIKDICKICFNFTEEQLHEKNKDIIDPIYGVTPRTCMKLIGNDFFKLFLPKRIPKINDNIWINILDKKITQCDGKNIVISDVRFINEYVYVKYKKAIVIKIIKTSIDEKIDECERDIDEMIPDFIINNYGTIDELYAQIKFILDSI